MAKITIEGSLSPSTYLARGERAVVRDDDPRVQKLIAGGYVNVIDTETDTPEPTPLPEPLPVPARNASRDDWAEWLALNTDIVTVDKNRETLLNEYDEWLKTHDAPAEDTDEATEG